MPVYELYVSKTSNYTEKEVDGEKQITGKRKEANRAGPLRKFFDTWLLKADTINGSTVISPRKDDSDRPLTAILECHHIELDDEELADKRRLKRVKDGVDEKGAPKPAKASDGAVWIKRYHAEKGKDGWRVVEAAKK